MRRGPELRSNASLPAAFERATGERIYDGLRNGFRVQIAFPDTLRLPWHLGVFQGTSCLLPAAIDMLVAGQSSVGFCNCFETRLREVAFEPN